MTEIPESLGALLKMADGVDGETIVFGGKDEIVAASPFARKRYPFLLFNGTETFEDLFWGIIKHGMSDAETLRVSPYNYYHMIKVSRLANDCLDFRKSYHTQEGGVAEFVCHHRRWGEWSAQLRVDIGRLAGRSGDYYTPQPDRVADALDSLSEAATLSALIDRLPIGVIVTGEGGMARWANTAAHAALRGAFPLDLSEDGHLHHQNPDIAARLAGAIATASRALQGSVTLSVGGGLLVSVSPGTSPGSALVLLPPHSRDDTIRACLVSLGLPPSIATTALAVVEAGGPAEAALATGKTRGTIRRQLTDAYNALGDMGVKSQRALAHLIGQIAAIQPHRQPNTWGHAP